MPTTAILIGPGPALERLERQLDLLADRPVSLGWVLTGAETPEEPPETASAPVLGRERDLEAVVARRRPRVALVSIPGVMHEQIAQIRTRLRRLGIPDRFMPTLEDQLAGVGPRSHFDVDPTELLERALRPIDETAVHSMIASQRVLITGAGGSIGGELARIVSRFRPEHLVLMDRSENALFEIDRQIARLAPDIARTALLHDVVDASGTQRHFERLSPQIIFHAAAHKHVPMMEDHPGAAVDNNLFGTAAVVDAAIAAGAARFVMISTDKAVNPSSIMGATKRMAELYVQHANERAGSSTACSMVRFGNVLGSSGSVLEVWSKQIADGGPLTLTDPEMTRYFMTIPEAASLVIESASLVDPAAPAGEVFVLDMGEPIRIVDMAERFVRMHGLTPSVGVIPRSFARGNAVGVMPIVLTGARPGEKLHEELAFDAEAMQPTRHPGINIWRLPRPAPGVVEAMVRRLDPTRRERDPRCLARQIREAVPETVRPAAA